MKSEFTAESAEGAADERATGGAQGVLGAARRQQLVERRQPIEIGPAIGRVAADRGAVEPAAATVEKLDAERRRHAREAVQRQRVGELVARQRLRRLGAGLHLGEQGAVQAHGENLARSIRPCR